MTGYPQDRSPAGRLESRRGEVMAEFERQLERRHRTVAKQQDARQAVLALAAEALEEMISAVRDRGEPLLPGVSSDDSDSEEPPADRADVAHALADFLGIATTTAAECVTDEPDRLASGIRALNGAVSRQVAQAATYGGSSLAEQLREVRHEERRHIARSLHDRLGGDLNVAHRHLELYEALHGIDPDRAHRRLVSARQALAKVLSQIRQISADLRFSDSFDGLAEGLRDFLASTATDGVTHNLVVTGEESHFPPTVRYEIYLAIREAIRNALAHSRGSSISILIDTRSDQLHAMVSDDGVGFPSGVSSTKGTGIASMEERVSLLGGSIHIEGIAGGGTTVEILVPAKS